MAVKQQLKKSTNIQKRRRLSELFTKGEEVRFNGEGLNEKEPKDDDIVIWVQPPSPIQRDMVMREATAARSRQILAAKNVTSAEGSNALAFVQELSDEDLLDYVLALTETERENEARMRVRSGKEWDNFEELQDAMRQWEEAEYPETEEWEPLMEKNKRFGTQLQEATDDLLHEDREALGMTSRSALERKAFERRSEITATAEFMKVYEQWMLYFACRDDEDHDEMFFEKPDEIREYPSFVQESLSGALAKFISDGAEAKN